MSGQMKLLAALLYGTGLRLTEGLRLRVNDVDFGQRALIVREGKGNKDRVVMLPQRGIAKTAMTSAPAGSVGRCGPANVALAPQTGGQRPGERGLRRTVGASMSTPHAP
jgi:integrase